jgi:ABC-2 type transport system ATP-binding protein
VSDQAPQTQKFAETGPEDEATATPRRPRPEDDIVPKEGQPRRPRPEDDVVPRKASSVLELDVSGKPPCWDGQILDVRNLTKVYNKQVAVNEMTFQLYPGDILGFLGPNGAGKTTTIRMLATVLAPDGGAAFVGGHSLEQVEEIRARVGYMPDFLGVYDDLLVREYLEFFARAYKISPTHRDFVIGEALETTRLTSLANNPVDGLSRGQKQRLGLARLLMHDPVLLLLDEPAAGLDPRARVDLRDILRSLQQRGKAMIVSSHILSDLSDFCNKVGIVVNGKLILFDETKRLVDQMRDRRRLRMRLLERSDEAMTFLQGRPEVCNPQFQGEDLLFEVTGFDQEVAQLHRAIFEHNLPVITLAEEPWDLQDVYLQATEGIVTRD